MRVLVWQWGRRGAGPRYAAELAAAFRAAPGIEARLSLSAGAELLRSRQAPHCDLPIPTYAGLPSLALRALAAPLTAWRLARWLRGERIDVALCAMPAALDLVMAAALRRAGVSYAVVVHDADLHPGDRFAAQIQLQRWVLRRACAVFALSEHVADRLRQQGVTGGRPVYRTRLPPFDYGGDLPPPGRHGGRLRLLSFGRLRPYKGLDLLADALALLGPSDQFEVRVVGLGPESAELDRLRALPGVDVDNRWVPEDEVAALLAWSDALVLSHREASQSGVAAVAVAAGRWVVATRVGGLQEQLSGERQALLCDPTPDGLADAIRTLLALNRAGSERRPATGEDWGLVAARMVEDLRACVP